MLDLIRSIRTKNRFASGILIMARGTVLAQLITLGVSPILTQLYTPAEFGVLTIFVSITSVLGTIVSLRYEMAIPLPESETEATNLTALCVLIALCMMFLLFGFTLLFGRQISNLANAQSIDPYIWALPLGVLVAGLFAIFNMWSIRRGFLADLSNAKVIQSVSTAIIQVAGASCGVALLIGGRLIGQCAGISLLSRKAWVTEKSRIRNIRLNSIILVGRKYSRFPLVSTWTALTSNLGGALTPLLFSSFFSIEIAGIYGLTIMAMAAPMAFIGKSVEDVFYREAVLAYRGQQLLQLVHGVHARLVFVAMPVFLVGFTLLPELFPFVFGAKWHLAGEFAMWMLPWFFAQFTSTAFTGVFLIIQKHGIALLFQSMLAIAPVVAFVIGNYISEKPLVFVQVLSAICSLIYLSRLSVAYLCSGGRLDSFFFVIIRFLPASLFCASPMFAYKFFRFDQNFFSPYLLICLLFSLLFWWATIRRYWQSLPNLNFLQ